jgi:hypothetical protein
MEDKIKVSQEERRVFFVETLAEEENVVMVNNLTYCYQVSISLEKPESLTIQILKQERVEVMFRALMPTTAV